MLLLPSPPSPHCVQNASITLPANGQVTALVPSESAIRRLNPDDRAFWLQPKMLPHLVRWGSHDWDRPQEGPSVWVSQERWRRIGFLAWHVSTCWEGPSSKVLYVILIWFHVPPNCAPPRAHFLQGALSEEELVRLDGQNVTTLNPTTRWEIHNISGV